MKTVRLDEVRAGVAQITLDRPSRLNAMSYELVADLHGALRRVEEDASCRVVVLTGEGRGFCAGFDLQSPGDMPGAGDRGRIQATLGSMEDFYGLVVRMRKLRQPVIAAVNGPAAGGGLALALGADIRVASETARFSVAFIRVGYSACDIGVSYLLPRLVGGARAAELMLTGRTFDAAEAKEMGLVLEVVPDGHVVDAALTVADRILLNSPLGVAMTKEVMYTNVDAPSLDAAIALEQRTNILMSFTEDHAEAISAWREKRTPSYRDR